MRQVKNFLLSVLLFVLFLFLGLNVYHWFKYPPLTSTRHPHYHDFKRYKTSRPKYYSKEVILKIGGRLSLPEERLQHFLNFPPIKKQEVIRIGAFGDSHTYGAEVGKTGTYPYQLQALFKKNFPKKNIEVLNFGVENTGFQEIFFFWEKYAKKYQLDYILLGPRGFYPYRDTTFIKWFKAEIYMPKTRFILSENNTLEQVHIKGHTLEERYKNYYRLIPPWIAFRYDRMLFNKMWVQMLFALRKNLHNPFYYKKHLSDAEESSQINILLLKEIQKQHPKKILFFTDHKPTYNTYQSIKELYNLNLIPFWTNHSLYYRRHHESSLGHKLLAKIYFNALLGKKDFFLNPINCSYHKNSKSINQTNSSLPSSLQNLDQVESIHINNGKALLSFLCNSSTYNCKNINLKTTSFITFLNHQSLFHSPLFPLPFSLKQGMKIYIQQAHNKIELGSIQPLDSHNKFFAFYTKYIKTSSVNYNENNVNFPPYVLFVLKKMPNDLREKIKTSGNLFLENHFLGHTKLEKGKRLRVTPARNLSFVMRGPTHSIKEQDLPDEFPLYIQYNTKNGEIFKSLIPDWKCKKQKYPIHLDLPNFEPLKL